MTGRDTRPRIARVAKAGATVAHLKLAGGIQAAFCLEEIGRLDDPWFLVGEDDAASLKQCDGCTKMSAGRSYHLLSMPKVSNRPKAEAVPDDAEAALAAIMGEAASADNVYAVGEMAAGLGPDLSGMLKLYPSLAADICYRLFSQLRAMQYVPVPYLHLAKLLYWLRRMGDDDGSENAPRLLAIREEMQAAISEYAPPGYEDGMSLREIIDRWGRPEAASVLEKRETGQ